jgi:hypothetical protein
LAERRIHDSRDRGRYCGHIGIGRNDGGKPLHHVVREVLVRPSVIFSYASGVGAAA